jgi:hypothetical protein
MHLDMMPWPLTLFLLKQQLDLVETKVWNTFCLAAERGQCARLSPHKDRVGGGNKGIPPHSGDNI